MAISGVFFEDFFNGCCCSSSLSSIGFFDFFLALGLGVKYEVNVTLDRMGGGTLSAGVSFTSSGGAGNLASAADLSFV